MIKSLMKDLEDEVSLRNTLASKQENPSSMQNKVRILQWSNIRMDSNYLHLPTKFGSEPRNLHFKDSHVASKERIKESTYMQNKISLMQMTCGYLWVSFFFFLGA